MRTLLPSMMGGLSLLAAAGCDVLTPPSPDPRVVQTQVAELHRVVKPAGTPAKDDGFDGAVEVRRPVVLDVTYGFGTFPAIDGVTLAYCRLNTHPVDDSLNSQRLQSRRDLPVEPGTYELNVWMRLFNIAAPDTPGADPTRHATSCTVRLYGAGSTVPVFEKTYQPADAPTGKAREEIADRRIRLKVTE